MEAPRPLTSEQVRKVAKLARLAITEAQVEEYCDKLGAVLGYMERLQSLDLSKVEPLTHPLETTNRLDDDEPGETISNETFMKMAPDKLPPFLKVPKVLGDGGGA
jgi:aspartyl-tRNA(Asn)/glutamyl-tRNA(Gln) amidotransferase subunit C